MTDKLPAGFTLDDDPPEGFTLDPPPSRTKKFVSGMNRSYAGMLGLPVDLVNRAMSYQVQGTNYPALPKADNPVLGSQQIGQGMAAAGVDLNQPRDAWGMLGEYLAPAPIAGPVNALKMGGSLGANVLKQTAREVVAGTAATGGGLLGQQIAEKTGGDPMMWEMAGSMWPAAAASLAAAAPRYSLRKDATLGSAFNADPAAQSRIAGLDAQGIPTTVGLATDSPRAKSVEAKLAASPGGYEVLRDVGRQADAAFDSAQQRIVGGSADSVDAAGTVAREGDFPFGGGIFGKGGWKDKWSARKNDLYARLDAKIGGRTPVATPNTEQFLRGYLAVDPSAPAISGGGKNSVISGWANRYLTDLQGARSQVGTNAPALLPYERIKQLRSEVGAALEVTDPGVLNSVDRAAMKTLYRKLSDDMASAAAGANATREFKTANRFYHQGANRIDTWLENLSKKVRPEDFWKQTISDSPQSATQLRAYKQMLTPDEWDYMVETVSNRWGKTAPGQETIAHQFQLNKWYTNWNKTPTEVRDVLFGKRGTAKRDAAELMAKNLDMYREQAQILFNSSGSGATGLAASAQYGAIGGAGTAVLGYLTGHVQSPAEALSALAVGTAGGVVAATYGSSALAKVMTNQRFAKWLAEGMKMPKERLPGHLMRLASISQNDPEMAPVAKDLIQSLDPELYGRLYR